MIGLAAVLSVAGGFFGVLTGGWAGLGVWALFQVACLVALCTD